VANQLRSKSERTGKRPSRQTVVNALNLLRVALEAAVDAGHIEKNPTRDVRAPKIARDTEGWDWLREDEVERLTSPANELSPEARRIYTFAISPVFVRANSGDSVGTTSTSCATSCACAVASIFRPKEDACDACRCCLQRGAL
jgi:hypothetical protein